MGRNRNAGFTLVELLVVIAIISILAGLLLPVLANARIAAQRTGCMNNLKQMSMSLVMYEDDWGCIPPSSLVLPDTPQYQRWTKTVVKAGYIEARTPNGYDGADGPLFICPGKASLISRKARMWNHLPSDYGLNSRFSYHVWCKMRSIRHPSQVYFMGDRQAVWDAAQQWWEPKPGDSETIRSSLSSYDPNAHDKTMNMLFFDGHVKTLPGMEPNLLYSDKWISGKHVVYLPWGDD